MTACAMILIVPPQPPLEPYCARCTQKWVYFIFHRRLVATWVATWIELYGLCEEDIPAAVNRDTAAFID